MLYQAELARQAYATLSARASERRTSRQLSQFAESMPRRALRFSAIGDLAIARSGRRRVVPAAEWRHDAIGSRAHCARPSHLPWQPTIAGTRVIERDPGLSRRDWLRGRSTSSDKSFLLAVQDEYERWLPTWDRCKAHFRDLYLGVNAYVYAEPKAR